MTRPVRLETDDANRRGSEGPVSGSRVVSPGSEDAPESWARRIGWFVLLWLGGVAVVALVGLVIRTAIMP